MFFPGGIEEGGDVSSGDDQGMARGNGEAVEDSQCVGIGQNDSGIVKAAEMAEDGVAHSCISPLQFASDIIRLLKYPEHFLFLPLNP